MGATNFGQPIEHSVPMVAHLKRKKAYIVSTNGARQVFVFTIRENYDLPTNLSNQIATSFKKSRKEERQKKFSKERKTFGKFYKRR